MRTEKQKRLLRATLEHIEKDQEHWDQGVWRDTIDAEKPVTRCNTVMCFAGWAVAIDGCRWGPLESDTVLARKDDPVEDTYYGNQVRIERRARRILGLDNHEAERLFSYDNRLDDLRALVAELTR